MTVGELRDAQLLKGSHRVDEHVAGRRQPGEQVDLMEQARVEDHNSARPRHRLADPDGGVGDAAERQNRCANPLGAEAREGLRLVTIQEGCDRQQLGGGDDALTAATVEPDLEQRLRPGLRRAGSDPPGVRCSPTRCRTSRRP